MHHYYMKNRVGGHTQKTCGHRAEMYMYTEVVHLDQEGQAKLIKFII